MFIDEQTRTVQKHILDVLYDHTGLDGGVVHRDEVERFRSNPHLTELSNFFYCRELKLRSWYPSPRQPSADQIDALWLDIARRCGAPELAAPDDFSPVTNISSLVQYVYLNVACNIDQAK